MCMSCSKAVLSLFACTLLSSPSPSFKPCEQFTTTLSMKNFPPFYFTLSAETSFHYSGSKSKIFSSSSPFPHHHLRFFCYLCSSCLDKLCAPRQAIAPGPSFGNVPAHSAQPGLSRANGAFLHGHLEPRDHRHLRSD